MFAVGKKIGSNTEQILYDHFLYVVKTEEPERVIERFRNLFIEGITYCDARIWNTIETLAFEKTAEQSFPLIINRCCYIIVNHWQMTPAGRKPIGLLIDALENLKDVRMAYSRIVRRLRQLLNIYRRSDDYVKLKRLNFALNGDPNRRESILEQPLGRLIHRYPYLYEHSLMSEDRSKANVDAIKQLQRDLRHQHEQNLSHYLSYQLKKARIKSQLGREAANNIEPVANPTLLSTKELGTAFGQFSGNVEGDLTYQDLSRSFAARMEAQPTIKTFKNDLYEYIIAGVDPGYGNRTFNGRLFKVIDNTLVDRNYQTLDELSSIRICTSVFNHLVIESYSNPQHFVFMDMISNLGSVMTTGILLKVVLICHKVKPLLENRLSILFDRYEASQCKGVSWLVKSLETWNVAGAIHFGRIDPNSLQLLRSISH